MAIHLSLALTFFNFVGNSAARVVLTLYALELGAPASAVGLIGGLLFLFPLLLSWPIGAAADRIGGRSLLLFGSVLGVVSLVLPFVFRSLPVLYVAAALNGLGLAFYHVTLQYLIGELSKPEERARNFSNFSLAGALTTFVGPMIAGFSIDTVGHANACLIAAAQSAVAVLLLLKWGRLYPAAKTGHALGAGSVRGLVDRQVALMLLISGFVQLGYDLFQFYIPIYAHSIGISASAIGAILATLAAGSIVVRLFLARLVKAYSGRRLLAVVFATGTIGFALIPLSSNALALALIGFVFGLGMGIGIPLTVILMFANSVQGRSGQTLGLRLTANNLVRFGGPIVFGAVGTAFGLTSVFWIVAVILAGGGLLSRAWRGKSQ